MPSDTQHLSEFISSTLQISSQLSREEIIHRSFELMAYPAVKKFLQSNSKNELLAVIARDPEKITELDDSELYQYRDAFNGFLRAIASGITGDEDQTPITEISEENVSALRAEAVDTLAQKQKKAVRDSLDAKRGFYKDLVHSMGTTYSLTEEQEKTITRSLESSIPDSHPSKERVASATSEAFTKVTNTPISPQEIISFADPLYSSYDRTYRLSIKEAQQDQQLIQKLYRDAERDESVIKNPRAFTAAAQYVRQKNPSLSPERFVDETVRYTKPVEVLLSPASETQRQDKLVLALLDGEFSRSLETLPLSSADRSAEFIAKDQVIKDLQGYFSDPRTNIQNLPSGARQNSIAIDEGLRRTALISFQKLLHNEEQVVSLFGQSFVESSFFTYIKDEVSKNASLHQHGDGLMSVLMGGQNVVNDVFDSVSTSKVVNETVISPRIAESYFTSFEIVDLLKDKPDLLRTFSSMPLNKQQAFMAAFLSWSDPDRAIDFKDFFHHLEDLERRDPKLARQFKEYLGKQGVTAGVGKMTPRRILGSGANFLLSQTYLVFLMYSNPSLAAAHIGVNAAQFVFNRLPVVKAAKLKIGSMVASKLGSGVVGGIAKKALGVLAGPIGVAAGVLFDGVKDLASGDKLLEGKKLSLTAYIVIGVLAIFLIPILLLATNSQVLEKTLIASITGGGSGPGSGLRAGPAIDCEKFPEEPICKICNGEDGKYDSTKCPWPIATGCISQDNNPGHATESNGQALDIGISANGTPADGQPVRATYPGVVIEARWETNDGIVSSTPDYGNMVRIRTSTDPSFIVIYSHLSRTNSVNVGQTVNPDTIIGYVDHTGMSSHPHLHFEVQGVPIANVVPSTQYRFCW